MRHLSLLDALKTFDEMFDSAQQELFKIEVLQDYSAVDMCPSLQTWLDGDEKLSRSLGKNDKNIINYRNKCLRSPAGIERIHIVKKPYTRYLNWEIAVCYKDSLIAHGAESISLVEANQLKDVGLPKGDLWIFDNTCVLQWEYEDSTGKTSGAQIWDKADDDNIEYFLELSAYIKGKASPISSIL